VFPKARILGSRKETPLVLGAYAMAMFVLGFGTVFGDLVDVKNDDRGLLLDGDRLPKRVRIKKSPTPL